MGCSPGLGCCWQGTDDSSAGVTGDDRVPRSVGCGKSPGKQTVEEVELLTRIA